MKITQVIDQTESAQPPKFFQFDIDSLVRDKFGGIYRDSSALKIAEYLIEALIFSTIFDGFYWLKSYTIGPPEMLENAWS